MEHENIRSEISGLSFSLEQQNAVAAAGAADTQDIVEYAREQNLVEHEKTRLELAGRITRAEDYIRSLEQQIQRMEQVVKDGIAEFVRRAPTMNPREQQTLKEITNAKFSLWTALQVLLERLKAFVVMLKTSASDERWSTSAIANAWKMIPYPFLSEQLGDVERPDCVIEQVESAEEVSRIATLAMLCYPIAAGDAKEVEIAINRGVEVNQRLPVKEFNGMTPLMFAIATAYGLTAFDSIQTILPMRRDVRKVIQVLLAHGADPRGVDAEGRDAMHVARNPQYFLMSKDRGNLPVDWTLEQLVEQSPDADVHHLMTLADIVWDGNLMQLRKMLQDVPEICSLADDYRASVLGIAAYRGIEEAARLILDAGASPDGPDPIGSTPLAIAVAMNRLAMVDLLLQHGAEFDSIDPFLGLNPLEYAAREGNEAVCGVFLKHILHKPNAALGEILSKSLCLAVRHYQTTTVELLLDNGADVHTNIGMYLAAWEIEAYHGANFGQRIDRMTPRTYVENKIRNRLVPLHLELASETLLKSLEAREKQTGVLNNHAKPNGSFERLTNVSARYHLNPKRSSFLFSSRPASPGIDSSTAVAA